MAGPGASTPGETPLFGALRWRILQPETLMTEASEIRAIVDGALVAAGAN